VPRLYDPGSGTVRIGGHDLRDLTLESLHDTVGVVPQDAHLFHDTIRANLACARSGATEPELIEACRAARIWDLVSSLPDGLDTVVGDRGYRLSGGERQRRAVDVEADQVAGVVDPVDRRGSGAPRVIDGREPVLPGPGEPVRDGAAAAADPVVAHDLAVVADAERLGHRAARRVQDDQPPVASRKNPLVTPFELVKKPATPPALLIAAAMTLLAPGTVTAVNLPVAMSYRYP